MKSIFSKFVLAPAVLAAAALAANSAMAETVKVPFSFTAGDKVPSCRRLHRAARTKPQLHHLEA